MIDTIEKYRKLTEEDAAQLLSQGKDTLILFHVHPDGDAVGSAFALRAFVEESGGRAWCVCADEVPERLLFAVNGQDSVLPSAIPEDFNPELTVSVDTASPAQLGELYEIYRDRIDLMIDHHGKGTPYADNCIVPEASACGEVLYEILAVAAKRRGIELSMQINQLLYTAISADTGCFRYNNATANTHTIAAELISKGVLAADINHKLFGIKTLKQMQVEHAGFERMNFYGDGKIAVITFPYDLKKQYGAEDEHLETLIDVARCVKGVEVAAVIKQLTAENKFRVSMRSSSSFDVSEVCAYYGGGGHLRAAGCTLTADSILTAEMTIVVAVEHRMNDQ
ncbi:MAG: bifunctional oligoribonuclease/PAP phosphatase NrnA [Clostridia bacterium]|nr:bifunctional oligoribonuclease/PAP phosphatase NrnA [Clostridia bacterium]